MKKILILMTCLILAIMFRMNLNEYNQRLYDKYYNLEPVRSGSYQSIKMSVSLDAPMDKVEKMHNEIMKYAKDKDIAIAIGNSKFKNNQTYNIAYIYGPSNFVYLDKKYCVENKVINFDDNKYYSSDIRNNDSYHLRYLNYNKNNRVIFEYYPMNQFSIREYDNSSIFYHFAVPTNLNLNAVNKDLTKYIHDTIGDKIATTIVDQPDQDIINNNALANRTKNYSVYVIFALFIVIILLHSISKQKEIGIFHLYNNKYRTMFRYLYLPLCIILLITILIVNGILYLIYIKGIYTLGLEFLFYCLKECTIYYLFFVIASIIISYIFWKMDIIHCLKKKLSFSMSNYFMCFLKVVIIISFLIPTYQSINNFKEIYYQMKSVIKYKDFYENSLSIITVYGAHCGDYFAEEEKAYELLTQQGGVYADYSYLELGEYGDQTHVSVNSNFLKYFPIKDENGQRIEVPLDENALLIPKSKKKDQLEYYVEDLCIEEGTCSIHYYEDQPVPLMDTSTEDFYKYNDGTALIYVVNVPPFKDGVSIKYPSFLVMKNDQIKNSEDVVKCLNGNLLSKKMQIEPGLKYASLAIEQGKEILKYTLIDTLFYVLVLTMFIYQTVYVYFYTEKEELAIRYIHGNKFTKRYGKLFVTQFLVDLITYAIGILVVKVDVIFMTTLIAIIICLEFIINIIFINYMEKNKLINVLKGDD